MQGRDKVLGEENIGHNLLKKMGEPFVLRCVWYYEVSVPFGLRRPREATSDLPKGALYNMRYRAPAGLAFQGSIYPEQEECRSRKRRLLKHLV